VAVDSKAGASRAVGFLEDAIRVDVILAAAESDDWTILAVGFRDDCHCLADFRHRCPDDCHCRVGCRRQYRVDFHHRVRVDFRHRVQVDFHRRGLADFHRRGRVDFRHRVRVDFRRRGQVDCHHRGQVDCHFLDGSRLRVDLRGPAGSKAGFAGSPLQLHRHQVERPVGSKVGSDPESHSTGLAKDALRRAGQYRDASWDVRRRVGYHRAALKAGLHRGGCHRAMWTDDWTVLMVASSVGSVWKAELTVAWSVDSELKAELTVASLDGSVLKADLVMVG